MFSDTARKTADACRFCWMCRHVCPVGLKTGHEINTPRAKGLVISLMERGTAFDADIARAMYECTLCGACSNDCVTGYEPPVFIREARTKAVTEGLEPIEVRRVAEKIMDSGNIYGEEKPDFSASGDPDAQFLLYIGDTAACRVSGMVRAILSIADKAGVPLCILPDEPGSGAELYDLYGDVEDVRALTKTLVERIEETEVTHVIVLNPADAVMLAHKAADWGFAGNFKVITATAFVAALVKSGAITPKSDSTSRITFHDPARLARDMGETDAVREIIAAMEIPFSETFLHGKLAHDCGSVVFSEYAPDLCALTAEGAWDDACRTPAQVLVTASPEDYYVLSRQIPKGYALTDLFELVEASL